MPGRPACGPSSGPTTRGSCVRSWTTPPPSAVRLAPRPLLASAAGDHRYDDRLPSAAPADLQRAEDRRRSTLQRLQAIDRAGLDVADRISYDMLARELKDDVADHEFGDWQLPINADTGFHTGFADQPRSTTFANTLDYRNY